MMGHHRGVRIRARTFFVAIFVCFIVFSNRGALEKHWRLLQLGILYNSRVNVCNSVQLPDKVVIQLFLTALSMAEQKAPPLAKIIHQSWKNTDVPPLFKQWSDSWRNANPGWEYRLWTDEDNRELVMNHYPWFLPIYDGMPRPILRVDFARNFYMHRYGGVYADLDTWCLRSMSNLSRGWGPGQAVVGRMSGDDAFPHNIPNAWMASAPGNPFWLFVVGLTKRLFEQELKKKEAAQKEDRAFNDQLPVESVTGPVALKDAHDTWQCMLQNISNLVTLPAGYIFISDWHNDGTRQAFNRDCNYSTITTNEGQEKCRAAYPDAHVLTYWTHSWEVPWWKKNGLNDTRYDIDLYSA